MKKIIVAMVAALTLASCGSSGKNPTASGSPALLTQLKELTSLLQCPGAAPIQLENPTGWGVADCASSRYMVDEIVIFATAPLRDSWMATTAGDSYIHGENSQHSFWTVAVPSSGDPQSVTRITGGRITTLATPSPTPTRTPPPGPPLRVELWGDSISAQVAPYFGFFVGLTGRAVAREHTFGGSALCDWLPDMRSEIDPSNPTGFHPQVAVIQFYGRAFTPCMHDANGVAYSGQALVTKYAADSAIAISMFTSAKIPVYFVSTPISRDQAAQGVVGNSAIGVMFSKLPALFRSNPLVRFVDGAAAVEWHGHYSDTLPCQHGERCTGHWADGTPTVVVRQADGTHFCPVPEVMVNGTTSCPAAMPGARRYVLSIVDGIAQDFPSLRLPAPPAP
jgi:hypothetical protein